MGQIFRAINEKAEDNFFVSISKHISMVVNYHQAVYCFPARAINLFLLESMPKPCLACKCSMLGTARAVSKIQVFWMSVEQLLVPLHLAELRQHFNSLNMSMNIMNVCVWETRYLFVLIQSSKDSY